jgi:hypothetical protein
VEIEHENQKIRLIVTRQEALDMIAELAKGVGLSVRADLECVHSGGFHAVFREYKKANEQVGPDYPASCFVFVEKGLS